MVKNAPKEESKVKRISGNKFNLDGLGRPVVIEKCQKFKKSESMRKCGLV